MFDTQAQNEGNNIRSERANIADVKRTFAFQIKCWRGHGLFTWNPEGHAHTKCRQIDPGLIPAHAHAHARHTSTHAHT